MTPPHPAITNPMAPLSRLLNSTLTVADIVSTPLWSVPESMPASDALDAMINQSFDIGGVTPDPPRLFISRRKLEDAVRRGNGNDPTKRHAVTIPASQCVEKSLPISILLEIFETYEQLFVLDGNSVRWVITHADLVAPAVSVAVLSHLTVIESGLKHLSRILTNEQVKDCLTARRRTKVQEVLEHREGNNVDREFRDGLFLADLLTVTGKTTQILNEVGYASRTALDDATSSFTTVRDDLAHGRSLLADNSKTVAEVLARVRRIREFSTAVWRAVEHRKPIWDIYATTTIATTGSEPMILTGTDSISDWPFDHPVFILTAWNPGGIGASAERNRAANERLWESLTRRGALMTPAIGHSTDRKWSEDSFLIQGLHAGQIAELAALFGQVAYFEIDRSVLRVCDSQTMDTVRSVDRRTFESANPIG